MREAGPSYLGFGKSGSTWLKPNRKITPVLGIGLTACGMSEESGFLSRSNKLQISKLC